MGRNTSGDVEINENFVDLDLCSLCPFDSLYIYIYSMYTYIYIEAYPLAFLNSLLPRISPAPMLPLRPVASTLWTKKLPRMDSQPSQSMQWTSYLLKSYQENHSQSGIRHPSKSFASSSIHQTHVPELVDACGFFNKARLLEGTWGNFSLEFPDPRNNSDLLGLRLPRLPRGFHFPLSCQEKILKGKNLEGRNLPPPRRLHLFFFQKTTETTWRDFEDSRIEMVFWWMTKWCSTWPRSRAVASLHGNFQYALGWWPRQPPPKEKRCRFIVWRVS